MRQIKASEVKPGMTIRWERLEVKTELTVREVSYFNTVLYRVHSPQGMPVFIPSDAEVTVLAEPHPEEPKAFGAKVIVNRRRFLRSPEGTYDDPPWLEEGTGCRGSWAHLCSLGTVTVIPDLGWTVPDDTPEVPERIEEWPEDDTALRAHVWRDRLGSVWRYKNAGVTTGWSCPGMSPQGHPWGSPFIRVIDA